MSNRLNHGHQHSLTCICLGRDMLHLLTFSGLGWLPTDGIADITSQLPRWKLFIRSRSSLLEKCVLVLPRQSGPNSILFVASSDAYVRWVVAEASLLAGENHLISQLSHHRAHKTHPSTATPSGRRYLLLLVLQISLIGWRSSPLCCSM